MNWIETYFKIKIFAPLIILGGILAIAIIMIIVGIIQEYVINPIKKKLHKK